MSLHRRAAKRDANERGIVEALRAAGASIAHLSGKGVPDLLISFHGRFWLAEVKQKKGKLTSDQVKWHANMRGQILILRTVDDALALIQGGTGDDALR